MKRFAILSAVSVVLLAHVPHADACTIDPYQMHLPEAESQDGSLVFFLSKHWSGAEATASLELRGSGGVYQGEVVEITAIPAPEFSDSTTSWLRWIPDEEVTPGDYLASVTVAKGDRLERSFEPVAVKVGPPDFESQTYRIENVHVDWQEAWSAERTCCPTGPPGNMCGDECTGPIECQSCWANEYIYRARLSFTTSQLHDGVVEYEIRQGTRSGSGFGYGQIPDRAAMGIEPNGDDPICVQAKKLNDDGTVLETSEISCRDLADFPPLVTREIDNSEAMAKCYVPDPVSNEDDETEDEETNDETPMDQGESESDEGCSTASSAAPTSLWFLIVFFALVRRRCTF